jgi:ABC-type nickel/cobalt efflux system permease component RcnA
MPDWSPANLVRASVVPVATHAHAHSHHGDACRAHGHGHAPATPPVADAHAFWGALGCSCFAF